MQGSGDVKYHLGTEGIVHGAGRQRDQGLPRRQPLAPRGGQPGARGHHPRQAGPDRQGRGRLHRAARADARRRGVRRPGRGGRDPEPVAAARLPHRRHDPRDRQQPGRLHHVAGRVALVVLLHRRGPDDPGADLPRERRRPRGLRAGGAARLRVPPGVQEGRRHRHGLLPAARSQRGRRPVDDAAADVRADREQALGAQALHRGADRSRRHLGRGGRAGAARLPGAAGAGLQRDPRGHRVRPRTRAPARASSRRPSSARRSAPGPGRPPYPSRSSSRSPTRTSRCPRASPCTPS